MERYYVEVLLKVEIDAFSEEDALDAAHDAFGEGEVCGLNVVEYRVIENDRLR